MKIPFEFPRVVAWELTRRCPMKCRHCRAGACDRVYADELTTAECRQVIDSLASGERKPMIIFTGGEPMTRPDLVEIVQFATSRGLRSVLAPCGLLVTEENLAALKAAGIMACSFSLDGDTAATHDAFRGIDGAFDKILAATAIAQKVGMSFQINTTVSRLNYDRLDAIYDLAMARGATRLDLFFLVDVGRGGAIADLALDDAAIAQVIDWAKVRKTKLTCCPAAGTCIGGRGFAFLSHIGVLQTCGFVEEDCGHIRDFDLDFRRLVAAAENPLGRVGNCKSRK